MTYKTQVVEVVEVIREMAEEMKYRAGKLDAFADQLSKTGDLYFASEALVDVRNCFANLKIDRLLTQALRDQEKGEKNE